MSLQHVLALEVKHHLHGKSSQEIGDLMQSMSNGELVALLKDFKVPYHHKRRRLKACEMIEEFKKQREDGYPKLKRSLMTDAQRMAAARTEETSEQRRARLDAIATRRSNENPEERRARLDANATRNAVGRSNETPEERRARLDAIATRRSNETPEERRARLDANATRNAVSRSNETPEETRARQEADALQHAERRANETPEETRARQEADALQHMMKKKDKIKSRWPSDDTTPWMQPGKDYILEFHQENPTTAQHLVYDVGGKWRERESFCAVAYMHVHERLEKRNDISSLDKLVGFCRIHIEGKKSLLESLKLAIPIENIKNEFDQWKNEDENKRLMNWHEARFEWLATTNVISLEDCKTRIVTVNWFESLIGLKLIVPGYWWNNCKAEDKSKSWRCEIESIDYHDAAERYFKIKCEDDQYPDARYEMSYKGVLKYMDLDQDGFSSFDLREQVPYFDPEYVAICEKNQTLLNYIESNPSYDDEKKRYVDVIDVVTFLYSYIVSHDLFVILL